MGLPTVHYFEAAAATNSSTVQAWMTKLHELLLAAGWSIEYADSDAIGGGSSGNPAWDKTPATNVDAGIVVYRMPANDHATEWFVRLRPGWSSVTDRPHMRGVQVGTGHSGGTLSGSVSTEAVATVATAASNSRDWQVAVSEDGLVVSIPHVTTAVGFWAERLRTPDGTVVDDVTIGNFYSTPAVRVVSATTGQASSDAVHVLGKGTITTTPAAATALTGRDAVDVPAVGPYFVGGYPMFGLPRLWFMAAQFDASAGVARIHHVDGQDRAYKPGTQTIMGGAGHLLVAME